jgi:hypothetical protein
MLYRLNKLSFGTSKVEKVFDIDIDLNITYFLHINNFGYIFLVKDSHCIGYIDNRGNLKLPWLGDIGNCGSEDGTMPLFMFPSSICYSLDKTCYLLEKGGSQIRKIDMDSKYVFSILGSAEKDNLNKFFPKFDSICNFETSCDIDLYGNLYWSIRPLHRCLKMNSENHSVKNYVGNGKPLFGSASHLDACCLFNPCGIQCINKAIYIADSGNHCIRSIIEHSINVVFGHPLTRQLLNPSQIKFCKGLLYIKDGNMIYYYSFGDKNYGKIYESENLKFIETNSQRDLLMLEKI